MYGNLNTYKYPPTLHITSLFIGGNPKQKETKYYREFESDMPQTIVVHGFVFNPTKIVTAICAHNDYQIPIANEVLIL